MREDVHPVDELVKANQAELPVRCQCETLGISTSGYYDWQGRGPSKRTQANISLLQGIRDAHLIERDLEGVRVEELPVIVEKPDRSFRLYGGKYGYTALRDGSGEKLVLVAALDYQPSEIDRKRSNAADPAVRFALSGTSNQASSEALDGMLDTLLIFSADQKQRKLEQRELALYQTWIDLLSAKTELEKMRCVQAPYSGREASGEFVRLKLKPDTDASALVGQDVMVLAGRQGEFRGHVVNRYDGYTFNNADEHFNDILRCHPDRRIDIVVPEVMSKQFVARMEKVFGTAANQYNKIKVNGFDALKTKRSPDRCQGRRHQLGCTFCELTVDVGCFRQELRFCLKAPEPQSGGVSAPVEY